MGGLSCGGSCMKVLLIIFNIIFFLTGALLLGVGIWMMVDDTIQDYLGIVADGDDQMLKGSAILLIVIGAVTFIVGFFGCLGAAKESPCLLATYGSFLIIILIVEIAAGILAAVFRNQLNDSLRDGMESQIDNVEALPTGGDSTNAVWHALQNQLKCCGVDNFTDYTSRDTWPMIQDGAPYVVPVTCCNIGDDLDNIDPQDIVACMTEASIGIPTDKLYQLGCHDALAEWFKGKAVILIGVAIAIALLQIVGVIVAFCLRRELISGSHVV